MRVLIVGAGILGLLTARACALRGAAVTLLEQGPLPATGATSWDQHRIVRTLHPGQPHLTALAAQAERHWRDLARGFSAPVYQRTGSLTALPPSAARASGDLLTSQGLRHAHLPAAELHRRYPLIRWPDGLDGVHDPQAGVLLADQILLELTRELARTPGVTLLPGQTVTHVDADALHVITPGGRHSGDALVLTAGLGTRRLLPAEPSEERRQLLLYVTPPVAHRAAWATLPAVPAIGDADGSWLIPPVAHTALKLTSHAASWVEGTRPDVQPAYDRLVTQFAELIPGFTQAWVSGRRTCAYRIHPERGTPVIRPLDAAGRACAVTACGGGAFKFAPLMADHLARRVLDAAPVPALFDPPPPTLPLEDSHAAPGH